MHTHLIGSLELDLDALERDLALSTTWPWSRAYSEFVFGGDWSNCTLFAPGGTAEDGIVTHHDFERSGDFTPEGRRLPYLRSIIEDHVDVARLTVARLATVADSVIVPHRDLLELDEVPRSRRSAHRLHLVLRTHAGALFSDDDVVYRMRRGELWSLDATRIHSVAVFGTEPRTHLMLDFSGEDETGDLTDLPAREGPDIPAESIAPRREPSGSDLAALDALAGALTLETLNEVLSIVIKAHYRLDGGPGFVWDTVLRLGDACGDPEVADHLERMHEHYTLTRRATDRPPERR